MKPSFPKPARHRQALLAFAFSAALGCTGKIESPPGSQPSTQTGAGAAGGASGSVGTGATSGTSAGGTSAQGGTGAVGSTTGGASGASGSSGSSGTSGSSSGGTSGSGAAPSQACASAAADTGPNVLRRLSVLEYQRSVQSLLKLADPPDVEGIPVDTERLGFRTYAEYQTMSAANLRGYLDKATELADALLADSARRTSVLGCQTSATDCLKSFVTSFGRLAFRRSLEQTEIDGIVTTATTNGKDTDDQFRLALEVLLSSPSFLFRVEVGNTADGLSTLTATEVASKLSFALLGRAPSAALLDQAASGGLDTPDALKTAAEAMLADSDAQAFFAAFFRQWLGFNTLRAPVKPPTGWSEALMPAMQEETDSVLRDFAWGGQSLLGALTANYTHVSPALATYYGLPAPASDGRVTFPTGSTRENSGLLTHASLLSAKSDGDLIAIRGNWLRKAFLCEELSPPPDLADQIGDLLVGLTRIEIVNKRNSMSQCVGCHASIDPIGVGFAQYDATGRFDSTIDNTGLEVMPGLPDAVDDPDFATIAELAQKLRALPTVSECVAKRAFLYVNGREPVAADQCTLESVTQAFSAGGESFPALLAGLVETPTFRLRRAPAPTP